MQLEKLCDHKKWHWQIPHWHEKDMQWHWSIQHVQKHLLLLKLNILSFKERYWPLDNSTIKLMKCSQWIVIKVVGWSLMTVITYHFAWSLWHVTIYSRGMQWSKWHQYCLQIVSTQIMQLDNQNSTYTALIIYTLKSIN